MRKYTGQPIEAIEMAMDRDKFLEADEAKEFGLIDEVFDRRPDIGEGDTTGAAAGLFTPRLTPDCDMRSKLSRRMAAAGACSIEPLPHWPTFHIWDRHLERRDALTHLPV